jgi:hypothetical protein
MQGGQREREGPVSSTSRDRYNSSCPVSDANSRRLSMCSIATTCEPYIILAPYSAFSITPSCRQSSESLIATDLYLRSSKHTHAHSYMNTHTHTHAHTYTHKHSPTPTQTHTHTYVHTYTHSLTYSHTHIHTFLHPSHPTPLHTHTHMQQQTSIA